LILTLELSMTSTALITRNEALSLTKSIGPLREGSPLASKLINDGRLMKAVDYCTEESLWGAQADLGREPFLLREDECNPGELTLLAIYQKARSAPSIARSVWVGVKAPQAQPANI
jgi:hypothetical protein